MSWRYASDTRIHSCKTYFFAACSRELLPMPSPLPPYALLLHNTNDSRNKKTPLAQITYYNNYNVSPRTNSIAFLIQGFDVMLYKVYLMLKKPNGKEKSPKTPEKVKIIPKHTSVSPCRVHLVRLDSLQVQSNIHKVSDKESSRVDFCNYLQGVLGQTGLK